MMATNSPRATVMLTPCSTSRGGRLMWNVLRRSWAMTMSCPACGGRGGGVAGVVVAWVPEPWGGGGAGFGAGAGGGGALLRPANSSEYIHTFCCDDPPPVQV